MKVYEDFKIIGNQCEIRAIYRVSYVDKAQKNKTIVIWHTRLGHVGYHKLKVFIDKFMLKLKHMMFALDVSMVKLINYYHTKIQSSELRNR